MLENLCIMWAMLELQMLIFTELAPRWIQSLSGDVRMCVFLCVYEYVSQFEEIVNPE